MQTETISDIIAEMRKFADEQERGNVYDLRNLATDSLRAYADRIEAAWEREAKAIATENAVLPAVCITKPVGQRGEDARGAGEEPKGNGRNV